MIDMTLSQAAFYHSSFTSWCLMQEISGRSPLTRNPAQEIVYKTFQNILAFVPVIFVGYDRINSNIILTAASATAFLLIGSPSASYVLQSHTTNRKVKKVVPFIERSINIIAKIINAALTILLVSAAFGTSAASLSFFYQTYLIKEALKPVPPVYVFHYQPLHPPQAAAPAAA